MDHNIRWYIMCIGGARPDTVGAAALLAGYDDVIVQEHSLPIDGLVEVGTAPHSFDIFPNARPTAAATQGEADPA